MVKTTPYKISKNLFKIFYAGRDKFKFSNIFSFDYCFKKNYDLTKTLFKKSFRLFR